jgi:hypothetical protein
MDFSSAQAFSMKKADNRKNFAAGAIINRRTQPNSPCRDKNKRYITGYATVYKAMSRLQPPAHAGSSLAGFSTLRMEAIRSSETSVHTRSTRRHIPEDGILHYNIPFAT